MKHKNKIVTGVIAALVLGLSLWCWLKEAEDFSDSERRVLAAFPKLHQESVLSGRFMKDFEAYAVDQFPAREKFRSLKSALEFSVFQKKDNHGIYIKDGYVAKQEYPLQKPMLEHASAHFQKLYQSYMQGTDVKLYFSIIPDKNYFLAENGEQLMLDYHELTEYMKKETDEMSYIDITDLLSIEDYYRTDTHWKQEEILDVAERLAAEMGTELTMDYQINTLEEPFYGVYIGQLALPIEPDTIRYCTNDALNNCKVTSYSSGKPVEIEVYDKKAAKGKDAYEMFLSGAEALLEIENPNAATDKELVVFRDSFGSSLVPLLVEGYRKITLVDTRYMQSEMIGQWLEFEKQDVLFLYSTVLLNNSLSLR